MEEIPGLFCFVQLLCSVERPVFTHSVNKIDLLICLVVVDCVKNAITDIIIYVGGRNAFLNNTRKQDAIIPCE